MTSDIVLLPPLRAATVRHVGPYPEVGPAFARLVAEAEAAGLLGDAAVLLMIFYDFPQTTAVEALRSDAGLEVEEGVVLPASLTERVVAGGRYLHARHVGPYTGLPAVWADLRERGMREHGVQRGDGPAFERYLNNPGNTAGGDLITDIYIPLR